MSLLRLPHQTPLFSPQNLHHHSILNSKCNNLSFSSSPFPLSTLSYTSNAKRCSRFVFHFSAITQDPAVTLQLESEQEEEGEFSRTRLIAQNVPWSCTAEDIRSLFEKYGTVLDVELSMYNKTQNRGLAFVSMGSPEEAQSALNSLESYELEGRVLRLNYARPKKKKVAPVVKPKPVPLFNLFVANLSYEARDKDLREFFDSEGSSVVSAEVIFHQNPRRPSGYGFVSFKTRKEAEAALSAFQGKIFMGRPLRVAKSRQFVKVNSEEDSHQSEDKSTELNSDFEPADTYSENSW